MTSLPSNWSQTTLGKIRLTRGKTVDPKKFQDTEFELYSVPSFETKRPEHVRGSQIGSSKAAVEPGTVLLCKINPRINRVWIVGAKQKLTQIASSEWIQFPAVDEIHAGYLCYFMQQASFREFLTMNVSGVGGSLMRIKPATIENYPIPLPPLPEQRRIVARIEEIFSRLDAGVAALHHAKALLKRYRQSVLAAAVTGELTKEWRDKNPNTEQVEKLRSEILKQRESGWPTKYKSAVPPEIPKGCEIPESWSWMSTDELVTEPLKNGLSLKGFPDPPGVAVIKLDALTENGFDYSRRQYLRTDSPKVPEIHIAPGDFLISRGNGTLSLLAKGALASEVPGEVIFPDTMIRFRFYPSIKQWISTAWRSRILRNQIESRAKTTAGIYKVAQGDLRPIAVPLPPLAEQHQIVAEVEARTSAIDHLEAEIERQISRANRLRQSTLSAAFSGTV